MNKNKSKKHDDTSYEKIIKQIVTDSTGTLEFTSGVKKLLIHGIIYAHIEKIQSNTTDYSMYEIVLKYLYNTDIEYAYECIEIDENIDEKTKIYMICLLEHAIKEVHLMEKIAKEES